MKKLFRVCKRVLGLPFYTGLLLIATTIQVIHQLFNWVVYGGEAVAYNQTMKRDSLAELYLRLDEKLTVDGLDFMNWASNNWYQPYGRDGEWRKRIPNEKNSNRLLTTEELYVIFKKETK